MSERKIVSPVMDDIKAHMKRGKIVSADEAVRVIRSGDTVALDGVVGGGAPDELIIALEKRFLESGEPRGLTLVYASGIGDGKDKGVNRIATGRPAETGGCRALGIDAENAEAGRRRQNRGLQSAAGHHRAHVPRYCRP